MAIHVTCPYCAHEMNVPDNFAGRDGRCPMCQEVFRASPTPAPRSSPRPRQSAPRHAPAPRHTPAPQPVQAGGEDEFSITAGIPESSTTDRVRSRGSRRNEVPALAWVAMVGVGVGFLLLVLGVMVFLTGGGAQRLAENSLGEGFTIAADPDAGFDPSRVSVPEPHPIRTSSDFIVPPSYLDDAVGVCNSFRYIPANERQYAWMQVLARYLASFEWELDQEPFRGTAQRKAELQAVVQRTLRALDQVQFTERRIKAVNEFADEAYDAQYEYTSIPIFAFGTIQPTTTPWVLVLEIEHTWTTLGLRKSASFTQRYSDDCRYMFVGYVLTNTYHEVEYGSGTYDILYDFRTYHIWAEEGSGAIAIPDG